LGCSHIQLGDSKNDGFIRSIETTDPAGDASVAKQYFDGNELPY
jgi:hypothetical protein